MKSICMSVHTQREIPGSEFPQLQVMNDSLHLTLIDVLMIVRYLMYSLIWPMNGNQISFLNSGLPEGDLQLPVPRPLRGAVLLRVGPRLGPLQVHVPLPTLHTPGMLSYAC